MVWRETVKGICANNDDDDDDKWNGIKKKQMHESVYTIWLGKEKPIEINL